MNKYSINPTELTKELSRQTGITQKNPAGLTCHGGFHQTAAHALRQQPKGRDKILPRPDPGLRVHLLL